MGRRVSAQARHTDFIVPDPKSYFKTANENTLVIAMIESPRGVANADSIAATAGIDVLWVGHFDLTHTLGIPAEFHHPDFLYSVDQVISAARRQGKIAGINPRTEEHANEWIAGFRALAWSNDVAIYRNAHISAVRRLRAWRKPADQATQSPAPYRRQGT
jgi:2-keto-3-deoxy-L-rhamnonate aldolase RhmA